MGFQEWRKSKKHRIGFLIVLIIILAIIAFIFEKVRWLMIGFIILILGAVGMEVYDYDLDLGKLWETGSLSESRVESVKDGEGNSVRLIGSCVKADVNCDNFATQADAQATYNRCAAEIEKNNAGIEGALKLDIYGLDRDKDGIVCEALPSGA
jgi:hypothetical protein